MHSHATSRSHLVVDLILTAKTGRLPIFCERHTQRNGSLHRTLDVLECTPQSYLGLIDRTRHHTRPQPARRLFEARAEVATVGGGRQLTADTVMVSSSVGQLIEGS